MRSPISSIFRSCKRTDESKLNILCLPTHESYQSNLAQTNAEFYLLNLPNQKTWNTVYRPLPPNVHILKPNDLPDNIEFDLVLSQNKTTQYEICQQISKNLGIPHVVLEHCCPGKDAHPLYIKQHTDRKGDVNVFISEYSKQEWGWGDSEATVISHGIQSDLFRSRYSYKSREVLSVVNKFQERDRECGFKLWENIIFSSPEIPFRLIGDNPKLSWPAKTVDELAERYSSHWVFLNTSLISPLPMSLLEAMSSECIVVSSGTCQIPEVIQHSKNGFMANTVDEFRQIIVAITEDPLSFAQIGQEARKTITEKFNMDTFVNAWNTLFREAVNS